MLIKGIVTCSNRRASQINHRQESEIYKDREDKPLKIIGKNGTRY